MRWGRSGGRDIQYFDLGKVTAKKPQEQGPFGTSLQTSGHVEGVLGNENSLCMNAGNLPIDSEGRYFFLAQVGQLMASVFQHLAFVGCQQRVHLASNQQPCHEQEERTTMKMK